MTQDNELGRNIVARDISFLDDHETDAMADAFVARAAALSMDDTLRGHDLVDSLVAREVEEIRALSPRAALALRRTMRHYVGLQQGQDQVLANMAHNSRLAPRYVDRLEFTDSKLFD